MRLDAEQWLGSYSDENKEQSFATTDEEFSKFSKEMKEVAKQQAKETAVKREKEKELRRLAVKKLRPNEAYREGEQRA